MESMIAAERDADLRKAYSEMLAGSLSHPEERDWYAMWMIERTDGTHVGDLCFKGVEEGRNPELGYGILEAYRGHGYATEAVSLALRWAFRHPAVRAVEAETDPGNAASQRVLQKCGFRPMGITGEEGPRFIRKRENEMHDFIIRQEKPEEYRAVESLVRESFWNVYRPGCSEHYVIHVLRDDPAFVRELDLVMELDGELIGQNMCMRAVIEADDGRAIPVLTMGPICIAPALKRQGFGKRLLDASLNKAAELDFGAVLFEGSIDFYGQSGFDYARHYGIRYHDLPEDADDSFFLCKELVPGYLDTITGVYQTPRGYYVDDKDVDAFDRGFPVKERLKLPGQIFG